MNRGTALLLYMAIAMAICFGWIGATDVYVMEGIVADGAREMVRAGEWAVPRLHGEIYMYKPPMAYWLAAVPLQFWGDLTEWRLRAPFALCSVVLGLAVLRLSGRVLGLRGGLICALATLTGGLMVQKLHLAEFDMPLALGVGVAIGAACVNLAAERPRASLWWLGYLGLTFGFLAKGIQAPMLFGPGLLAAALITSRARALLRPAHLVGVGVFLALAGGWVASVVGAAGWEAFDQPLLEARHKGFTEWSWSTLGTALTKPLLAVVLFLPWSILLPVVLRSSWWRGLGDEERRLAGAAAAFLVAGAVALTVVPTSESRYFLPLAVPAGVLFGMAVRSHGQGAEAWRVVDGVLPILAGAGALAVFAVAFGPWPVGAPMRGVAAALGAGTVALGLRRRRPFGSERALLVLAVALVYWTVHTAVLEPGRVETRSLRGVAEAFRPHLAAGETIWTTPVRKGFHHSGLFFYLGRQVRTVGEHARPVAGSALVLFSDEPAGRSDYALPVTYAAVEIRRRRGVDFVFARSEAAGAAAEALEPSAIRAVMERVADWQLAHPRHPPRDWTNAVFYAGVLAAHRVTGEDRYLNELLRVGRENRWQPGPRARHADDHAIAQTYLDLYRIRRKKGMMTPFRKTIDRMMRSPPDWPKPHQTIDYWWSDALFMSPPALARLAAVTGERKYLDLMDRLWREAHELLYDEEESLFYRDSRKMGGARKTFWSRGNAWVLAGIARVLEVLPADHPSREFYLGVYREMSLRVAEAQPGDGLWRSDLHASPLAAPGESSGSALFCHALAWGVRHGVLDRERFLPVVEAAWSALYANVDPRGRLGWVQRPGVGPGNVRAEDWEVYGTGAFLLAGEAVLGLLDGDGGESPEHSE